MPPSSSQNSPEPGGLLRTLASFSFGVFLGLVFSKLKAPPQQSMNSISPKPETENENARSDVLPPLHSQVPPSPRDSPNSRYCCHNKTPWWKITLETGTFLVAAGACIAAGVYARISDKMWREMQKQTSVAERPWVGIREIIVADKLTYTKNGTEADFTLGYVLKNVGRAPAFVKVYGRMLDEGDDMKIVLNDFCNARRTEIKTSEIRSLTSYIAIPDLPTTVYIPSQPLLIHRQIIKDGYFQPYGVGCVFYQSVTDKTDEIHETRFYSEITTIGLDGKPPAAYESRGIRVNDGDIPMKKLCAINLFSIQHAD